MKSCDSAPVLLIAPHSSELYIVELVLLHSASDATAGVTTGACGGVAIATRNAKQAARLYHDEDVSLHVALAVVHSVEANRVVFVAS